MTLNRLFIDTKNTSPALRLTIAALAFAGFYLFAPGLAAQTAPPGGPDLSAARELLAMPVADANEAIKKYNAKEAEILNTQLLALLRPRNPDVDRVYGMIKHLETLRADAQAQNRLNTLLYVMGLTLILFTGFLTFVMIDQRRSMRALQKLLGPGAESGPDNSSHNVYRGD